MGLTYKHGQWKKDRRDQNFKKSKKFKEFKKGGFTSLKSIQSDIPSELESIETDDSFS